MYKYVRLLQFLTKWTTFNLIPAGLISLSFQSPLHLQLLSNILRLKKQYIMCLYSHNPPTGLSYFSNYQQKLFPALFQSSTTPFVILKSYLNFFREKIKGVIPHLKNRYVSNDFSPTFSLNTFNQSNPSPVLFKATFLRSQVNTQIHK